MRAKSTVLVSLMLAGVLAAYWNHFENPFHFDDSHAVVDNPYIRDLRNAPRFFTDASTFSNLPANRAYRPLIPLSLAVDYRLSKGLKPFYFQLSTFLWFLLQLVLMQALFRKVCDMARPDADNRWVALAAAALYGLHPANAETVNYIIQRGDVYSTLGVVAGIAIYALAPRSRRFGFYLIPVAAALLSKPPALIFPVLLFVYIWLIEEAKPVEALRSCFPALALAAAFGILTSAMTPKAFTPGAVSGYSYRITQPLVALRYFRSFFVPNELSADTDHAALAGIFDGYAWVGFLFVGLVVAAAIWCSTRKQWRPAAFGLWWFLLALLPTAVFPLAEVENDHRMYFPFVGLALAVCWPIALWLYGLSPWTRGIKTAVAMACLAVMVAAGAGARERNKVWHSDEALWYDVTVKSPQNGRGLMNYGLTQMAKGDTVRALEYFERARVWTPNYYVLEINLGIANGVLKRQEQAQEHFLRAIQLAPEDASSRYFYARWLQHNGREQEALTHLRVAVAANPDYLPARYLLMEVFAAQRDWAGARASAADTAKRFPGDATALQFMAAAPGPQLSPLPPKSADDFLNVSLRYHQQRKFEESIVAAREALKLKPDYAEAYNNIAAAYEELADWDSAIVAARQAVKLKPDFQLARNNLLWSVEQKRKSASAVTLSLIRDPRSAVAMR